MSLLLFYHIEMYISPWLNIELIRISCPSDKPFHFLWQVSKNPFTPGELSYVKNKEYGKCIFYGNN